MEKRWQKKVELIIEVENVGAIKNIRDTQKAFQEMHDESASKSKKHQDSIADLDKQMKKLFMENKNGFSDVAKMEGLHEEDGRAEEEI